MIGPSVADAAVIPEREFGRVTVILHGLISIVPSPPHRRSPCPDMPAKITLPRR